MDGRGVLGALFGSSRPSASCMAGIFLSYRRDDASAVAGRLYDSLARRFPRSVIFRDIDAIRPGVSFAKYIREAVAECDALVALIGTSWLTTVDEDGKRRLDNEDDWVRLEIASALQRGIPVIPTLINGAVMPSKRALPEPLRELSDRQNFEIVDRMWEESCDRLASALRPALVSADDIRPWWRRRPVVAGITTLCVVAVAIGYFAIPWDRLVKDSRTVPEVSAGGESAKKASDTRTAEITPPVKTPDVVTAQTLLDLRLAGDWQLDTGASLDAQGNPLKIGDKPFVARITQDSDHLKIFFPAGGSAPDNVIDATIAENSMVFDIGKREQIQLNRSTSSSLQWSVMYVENNRGTQTAVASGEAQGSPSGHQWSGTLLPMDRKDARSIRWQIELSPDGRTGIGKAFESNRLQGTFVFNKVKEASKQ